MSIPLVQNNDKDAINTSIIAIKRNIERINMLLGLSNSEEIDTSEFVKKSEIVDEVTVDNMHSVTSNAVAEMFFNSLSDDFTISMTNKTANVTGILYVAIFKSDTSTTTLQEDNVFLLGSDMYTGNSAVSSFTVLIRKGHSYRLAGNGSIYFQKFVKLF